MQKAPIFMEIGTFSPVLGVRRGGRLSFRATGEASFEVVVDRVRAGDAAFGGLLHVLVEGEVRHIHVGIGQRDGVFEAFAERGQFTQAGQQVLDDLAVLGEFRHVEEARDEFRAGGHVGFTFLVKGQRLVADLRERLALLFGEIDDDAVEGGFERHDGVNDGGLLGRRDVQGDAVV